MAEKAAAPRKAAAKKAAATTKAAASAEPTAAPSGGDDGTNAAPEGVLTLESLRNERPNGRGPESGPSDTSEGVNMTGPDGGRVTVPERMVPAMKAQGFTRK